MARMSDNWMSACTAAAVVAALLACKKTEDKAPEPLTSAAPEASVAAAPTETASAAPTPSASASAAAAVEVKRYGDQEKPETGTVKVKVDTLDVYPEADESTEKLTTLTKDTAVKLKASYAEFYLIEYPSDAGEPPLGWISSKDTVVRNVVAPRPTAAPTTPAPAETSQRRRRRR
jgi:hypothetical protein